MLLAALFDSARGAALAGDLAMARIAHEAIGKLLATETAPTVAPVVDLAELRERADTEGRAISRVMEAALRLYLDTPGRAASAPSTP